jgi:hypothetical protein
MARKSYCLLAANMTMFTGAWDNGLGIAIAGFGVSQFAPPTGCLCRILPDNQGALTFGPSMTSAAEFRRFKAVSAVPAYSKFGAHPARGSASFC